ncbi:regulation of response to stimulus [Branchiostoma belcheri]|nr:regulation of response to stimulus [Branchiostoma belcheri]
MQEKIQQAPAAPGFISFAVHTAVRRLNRTIPATGTSSLIPRATRQGGPPPKHPAPGLENAASEENFEVELSGTNVKHADGSDIEYDSAWDVLFRNCVEEKTKQWIRFRVFDTVIHVNYDSSTDRFDIDWYNMSGVMRNMNKWAHYCDPLSEEMRSGHLTTAHSFVIIVQNEETEKQESFLTQCWQAWKESGGLNLGLKNGSRLRLSGVETSDETTGLTTSKANFSVVGNNDNTYNQIDEDDVYVPTGHDYSQINDDDIHDNSEQTPRYENCENEDSTTFYAATSANIELSRAETVRANTVNSADYNACTDLETVSVYPAMERLRTCNTTRSVDQDETVYETALACRGADASPHRADTDIYVQGESHHVVTTNVIYEPEHQTEETDITTGQDATEAVE